MAIVPNIDLPFFFGFGDKRQHGRFDFKVAHFLEVNTGQEGVVHDILDGGMPDAFFGLMRVKLRQA